MADDNPASRDLPIELSSIVITLETLTREMVRKLSREEADEVVANLCERLQRLPGDKRGPNRPFTG